MGVDDDIRGVLSLKSGRQRTQKKNNIVNRFHRIGLQKSSTKFKKNGFGPFKYV